MPSKPKAHRTQRSTVGRNPQDDERRMQDEKLAAVKRFRSSARWQRFQSWFLDLHPLCADPFKNHARNDEAEPATSVHHVVMLAEDMSLGLSEANCRGLCAKCHNAIGAVERKNPKKAKRIFITRKEEDEIRNK